MTIIEIIQGTIVLGLSLLAWNMASGLDSKEKN